MTSTTFGSFKSAPKPGVWKDPNAINNVQTIKTPNSILRPLVDLKDSFIIAVAINKLEFKPAL